MAQLGKDHWGHTNPQRYHLSLCVHLTSLGQPMFLRRRVLLCQRSVIVHSIVSELRLHVLEMEMNRLSNPDIALNPENDDPTIPIVHRGYDLSRALLSSVARNNLATLRSGLEKLTKWWSGIAWISGSLAQQIEGAGVSELDLTQINEQMKTFVSLPDAGLAARQAKSARSGHADGTNASPGTDFGERLWG